MQIYIDGNHLAYRNAHIHSDLIYNGKPTGMIFGFLKSLSLLKSTYTGSEFYIVWDRGSKRRKEESKKGVEAGIIPESYKQNRSILDSHMKLIFWQMEQQWPLLYEILGNTSFTQIYAQDYEADDVIASRVNGTSQNTIIFTGDKDYYQLLSDYISIQHPKGKLITLRSFRQNTGLQYSEQWVDVGALAGDVSDNIFGVPGIGEATAIKLLRKYTWIEDLYDAIESKYIWSKGLCIEQLLDYIDDIPKREFNIIRYKRRVLLAFSLKKMDRNIPISDFQILKKDYNPMELNKFFENYGMKSMICDYPLL